MREREVCNYEYYYLFTIECYAPMIIINSGQNLDETCSFPTLSSQLHKKGRDEGSQESQRREKLISIIRLLLVRVFTSLRTNKILLDVFATINISFSTLFIFFSLSRLFSHELCKTRYCERSIHTSTHIHSRLIYYGLRRKK